MSICNALEYLPEHLVSPEIAEAAIEEGKLELLSNLPQRYLTSEVILSIIEKNTESYSWRGFDLGNIPTHLRSAAVCEFAVKKNSNNIVHTPKENLTTEMLSNLITSVESNLKYLHLFPESAWTMDDFVRGVSNIYSKTVHSTGPRGGYRSPTTVTDLKAVAIFMSYAPKNLKNKTFYMELFDTKLSVANIDELTPTRHKDKEYYLRVAQKDFSLVPESFYDYDLFLTGIRQRMVKLYEYQSYSYYRNDPKSEMEKAQHDSIREKVFALMDAAMADVAIEASPEVFKCLPKKFQTSKRLVLAIEKSERDKIIYLDGNEHLFTEDVCKAYIHRNRDLPKLPETIWTPDFVEYCMTHGTNFQWFEQLPKEMQTLEIVEKAMNYSLYNAKHIRPELISIKRAKELYRPNDTWDKNKRDKEYVPAHYLKDFCNETGLTEEFFGGEVNYHKLRESRGSYTYCQIGHCYIGFIDTSTYRGKDHQIILTRRTPASFRPVQVFERSVQTFHTTWLEKLIADNDPTFVKPSIGKALKSYSINGYFSLKKVASVDGADIYANNILGGTAYYTAMLGDERLESSSLEKVKEQLLPVEEEELAVDETTKVAEEKAA